MKKCFFIFVFIFMFLSIAYPRDIFDIAENGTPEELKAAIENGADIHARNIIGLTALHAAALDNEDPEMILVLVNARADINAKAYGDITPMHLAAGYNRNPEVVLMLINCGADAKAETIVGRTPWDYLQDNEDLKDTKAYWALNDARFE